jgi:uncharacterized Tic20 family protein
MSENESQQSNTWGMLCHLSSLCGFIGIPFGHLIGPLVVWLVKKQQFPFVDDQGKESLNFQITMTIYAAVALLLTLVLIGFLLLIALLVIDVVFVIIASIKASNGEEYRYPPILAIKFIK